MKKINKQKLQIKLKFEKTLKLETNKQNKYQIVLLN